MTLAGPSRLEVSRAVTSHYTALCTQRRDRLHLVGPATAKAWVCAGLGWRASNESFSCTTQSVLQIYVRHKAPVRAATISWLHARMTRSWRYCFGATDLHRSLGQERLRSKKNIVHGLLDLEGSRSEQQIVSISSIKLVRETKRRGLATSQAILRCRLHCRPLPRHAVA